MLINLTNHESSYWSKAQTDAAQEAFGGVIDLPFPAVDAAWEESRVLDLAGRYAARILRYRTEQTDKDKTSVLVQGEFTFVYALVTLLKKEGIPCYAACSDRCCKETVDEAGATHKTAAFQFVRFRRY